MSARVFLTFRHVPGEISFSVASVKKRDRTPGHVGHDMERGGARCAEGSYAKGRPFSMSLQCGGLGVEQSREP